MKCISRWTSRLSNKLKLKVCHSMTIYHKALFIPLYYSFWPKENKESNIWSDVSNVTVSRHSSSLQRLQTRELRGKKNFIRLAWCSRLKYSNMVWIEQHSPRNPACICFKAPRSPYKSYSFTYKRGGLLQYFKWLIYRWRASSPMHCITKMVVK